MESKPNQLPGQDPDSTSISATDSGAAATGSASTAGSQPTAGATGGQAPAAQPEQGTSPITTALNGAIDALNLGALGDTAKKWLDQSGVQNMVSQLPQNIKDLSSKATTQVNKLSTTQKVVGGALLLGGIGWLTLSSKGGKKSKKYKGSYSKDAYRGSTAGSYGSGTDYSAGARYRSGDSYGSRYGATSGSSTAPGTVNETSYRGAAGTSASQAYGAEGDSTL